MCKCFSLTCCFLHCSSSHSYAKAARDTVGSWVCVYKLLPLEGEASDFASCVVEYRPIKAVVHIQSLGSSYSFYIYMICPAPMTKKSPPCLAGLEIPLLYADEDVLLSCCCIELQRLLKKFAIYHSKDLEINYGKCNILLFQKRNPPLY